LSNFRTRKNQNERAKENPKNERKVAVVTGSSSGIGYATALQLARSGYFTFATMRNPEKGGDLIRAAKNEELPILVEQLDVTNLDSIKDFMSRRLAVKSSGRIDVLVNNAGYALMGSLEDLSIKEIQDQLETNLLGAIRVTQQVLPVMRAQGSGIIVNISSGVGRIGFQGLSGYVATKFALEGLSESLAYEVGPFGIKVVLIEPGVVKTKAFDNMVTGQAALRKDSPYAGMLDNLNLAFKTWLDEASTPDQVAATILQAISSQEPKLRYAVGQDVVALLEKRRTLSDEQFQEHMKNLNSMVSLAPKQR
jgi:NAD(P)-dependent dehydrogenase (short-subunit alcohol dehydrogenase family)